MEISPAGFLYIILIGYIIQRKNSFTNLFLLTLITEAFLRMGYFVKIGELEVKMDGILQYVLIAYCVFHLKNIPSYISKAWFFLICSFVIPIALLAIFPSDALVANHNVLWDEVLYEGASLQHPSISGFEIKANIKLLLMTVVYLFIYKNWEKEDYLWALNKFSNISNIFLLLGVLEFFVKNVLGLNEVWGELLASFWGKSQFTAFAGRYRGGGLLELNLFTLETSHYVNLLFLVLIAKFANNVIKNRNNKIDGFMWIAIVLMMLSTSFSVVYTFAAFISYYIIYRWNIQRPRTASIEKLVTIGTILFLVSSFTLFLNMGADTFVGGRLITLTEKFEDIFTLEWNYGNNIGDESIQARMVSMIQTMTTFMNRPVFGYSSYSILCHSATTQFLAGVGLFGLFCWCNFYFFVIPLNQFVHPVKKLLILGLLIFLIKNIFSVEPREFYGLTLLIYTISFSCIFSERIGCIRRVSDG